MNAHREEGEPSEPKSEPHPTANTEDDESDMLALRSWFDGLLWQDPRYNDKVFLKLAALAMHNDEMRQRLINEPESLVQEVRSHYDRSKTSWADPLESVTVRFWENTPDTLHVVLPPKAGYASMLPERLQDTLRSRTSLARESHGRDDWYNFGDCGDAFNTGDKGQDYYDT
ncbi:hypothetical protein ACFVWY_25220 [Streptomyces sp. NPDC058195]|uniref:hypothetical protein n=1 Tax=Streptomyces sp. NPDC058195 TaxID=3346375 RepID=UPI0036F182FD